MKWGTRQLVICILGVSEKDRPRLATPLGTVSCGVSLTRVHRLRLRSDLFTFQHHKPLIQ